MTTKPNPGSDEAIEAGCTCPVIDNGHGRGSGHGEGIFWVSDNCPVHSPSGVVEGPCTVFYNGQEIGKR